MNFIPLLGTIIPWVAAAVAAGGIVATGAGFLGRMNWVLDLFSHFRPQYFLVLTLSSFTLFLYGQVFVAAISGIFALVNLIIILPLYFSGQKEQKPEEEGITNRQYRAVSINVLQDNQEYELAAEFIINVQPDILLLVEVNSTWLEALGPALDCLPFSIHQVREDNYGIALFSRFPMVEAKIVELIGPGIPSICSEVALEGFKLTVLGTHPAPPKSRIQSEQRNHQLQKITDLAASTTGPLIVMGDLNVTPWSPYFKGLLAGSGLKDSRRGFGIQATWPVRRPHLWIPIDHILVSSHIQTGRFYKGGDIGSDHFPVICSFSIK
jgi:endonuclease/exonuclease/phosphatase (EEP) superfamily protein YafD